MSTARELLELETYRAIQNKRSTFKIYYSVTGAPGGENALSFKRQNLEKF
jgi:hypothetical protein